MSKKMFIVRKLTNQNSDDTLIKQDALLKTKFEEKKEEKKDAKTEVKYEEPKEDDVWFY